MKTLQAIRSSTETHWVGDGFPVRNLFSYDDGADELSPFLLLDYAGPTLFSPTTKRRGVGSHPHRGFETVTIVYDGEVEHRDSAGGGGRIGAGDVQWMTAASGVVHEEFHSENFSRTGGPFELVQLWVNLPRRDKMGSPSYQSILSAQIPLVALPGGNSARIIAGELGGKRGPARTHTIMDVFDLRLKAGTSVTLPTPEGHTSSILVLSGKIELEGAKTLIPAELALFSRTGVGLTFKVLEDAKALFLGGEPIHEPIVGHGPFVMNSISEIKKAYEDFHAGKMGEIPPRESLSKVNP
jgi:redox-sensitive bicupin YhaK (pirin superfamily)